MDEFEIVPSEHWPSLFDSFNTARAGWLVRQWSVDTANLKAGISDNDQAALQDLKLDALNLEKRGEDPYPGLSAAHGPGRAAAEVEAGFGGRVSAVMVPASPLGHGQSKGINPNFSYLFSPKCFSEDRN